MVLYEYFMCQKKKKEYFMCDLILVQHCMCAKIRYNSRIMLNPTAEQKINGNELWINGNEL